MKISFKRLYFLIMLICCASVFAQQSNCEDSFRYRHFIIKESDKFIKDGLITDTFKYYYRPEFHCRYMDEDYLLCKIKHILDTISSDNASFTEWSCTMEDVCLLKLSVQLLEYYKSPNDPFIFSFFGEQLFEEELGGKRNYGLLDYYHVLDSCVHDTSIENAKIFLLVKMEEIPLIDSLLETGTALLCNINQKINKKEYFSDIFFLPHEYDTTDFYSLMEWRDFLHRRIIKVMGEKHCNDFDELDSPPDY